MVVVDGKGTVSTGTPVVVVDVVVDVSTETGAVEAGAGPSIASWDGTVGVDKIGSGRGSVVAGDVVVTTSRAGSVSELSCDPTKRSIEHADSRRTQTTRAERLHILHRIGAMRRQTPPELSSELLRLPPAPVA